MKGGCDKLSMRGKVTLVTGGAKGMGAAHSRLIAARGGAVIVADIDEAGEALADEIRGSGAEARFVGLAFPSGGQRVAATQQAIARDGRRRPPINKTRRRTGTTTPKDRKTLR